MGGDDWPEMSYMGAMMADLCRKGIAPEHDEAEARRRMDELQRQREAKDQAIVRRRANLPPVRIIADVLRGKRPKIGRAIERKAHEIVAALDKAGWHIKKADDPSGDTEG
jgi:hypothetical protein